MGVAPDGRDSKAVQIVNENYWNEIEVLVCVVSDSQKDTSSTAGMRDTVVTSELIKYVVTLPAREISSRTGTVQRRSRRAVLSSRRRSVARISTPLPSSRCRTRISSMLCALTRNLRSFISDLSLGGYVERVLFFLSLPQRIIDLFPLLSSDHRTHHRDQRVPRHERLRIHLRRRTQRGALSPSQAHPSRA